MWFDVWRRLTILDMKRAMSNATRMSRTSFLLLASVFLASVVAAHERPQGLLWHRSGLAATLPLQVKTDPGADYLLHLQDVKTGQIVLAAYIRGGEFFRVLAPPGTFELNFFFGKDWQGEAALFAPETQSFILDRPLTFGASVSRKNGHLIDLRGGGDITIRDFAFCQRLALDPKSLSPQRNPVGKHYERPGPNSFPPPKFETPRYILRSHVCH